jgi:hypothetical protein
MGHNNILHFNIEHTIRTLDLGLCCIRHIPKIHSRIESKILFRQLLFILQVMSTGKTNFTLSFHYSGLEGSPVRIQHVEYFVIDLTL